jgi:hypothetical protein
MITHYQAKLPYPKTIIFCYFESDASADPTPSRTHSQIATLIKYAHSARISTYGLTRRPDLLKSCNAGGRRTPEEDLRFREGPTIENSA